MTRNCYVQTEDDVYTSCVTRFRLKLKNDPIPSLTPSKSHLITKTKPEVDVTELACFKIKCGGPMLWRADEERVKI